MKNFEQNKLIAHVTKIDVSTWTAGVYSYNIISDKEQFKSGKFIKID
jgi:hypothetical protein